MLEQTAKTSDFSSAAENLAHPEKPSQIKFVRPAQMSLFAHLTCYPPLGQATLIPPGQQELRFDVLLESSRSFPEQTWEVAIWHDATTAREWVELPLQKCPPNSMPMSIGEGQMQNPVRYLFSGAITRPEWFSSSSFTVKYRTSPQENWQWMNHQFGARDGHLFCTANTSMLREVSYSADSPRDSLSKVIAHLNDALTVKSLHSESPGAKLWTISHSYPATTDITTIKLGRPVHFTRFFSIVRIWSPWLAPRHGKDHFQLTEDAILCSFLLHDGSSLVLLAVSGVDDALTVFQSDHDGYVVVSCRNDNQAEAKFQVVAALADTFESANCAVMYEARKIVRNSSQGELGDLNLGTESVESPIGSDVVLVENDEVSPDNDENAQWVEDWYDGLSYCTWNGLGQDLTEQKIYDALDELKANNITVGNLIIDDNWQSLDNYGDAQFQRGWTNFDANKEGFPQGLKHTVDQIRKRHPKIDHIAVWHALLGYWGGISPDGDIAKTYKTKEVIKAAGVAGGTMLAVDPDDVARMFDDFYSFLSSTGIDSVKTDAQFFLDLLDDPIDRKRFTTVYQDAWSVASLRYFSARAISCMSQVPQIMFHSQLPTNKPRILLRNSDDFFPDVPASHPWHVFCNAHNSLFTQHLNILPDWDMFQTSHPYSSFHAAARCVSGGPIYITDEPGKHSIDLIHQMTAHTTRGNSVILRPSVVGKTIDIYHDYNEEHMLRIGTYNGAAGTGNPILGCFNIAPRPVSAMFPLSDFRGIESNSSYIIREHTTGQISPITRPDGTPSSLLSLSLEPKGYEILTVHPISTFHFPLEPTPIHIAPLGLLHKMTGACALTACDMYIENPNGRLKMQIGLKALGVLGVYIDDLEEREVGEMMVLIRGRAVPVECVGVEGKVLQIDVEGAWERMGLEAGWGNEVEVEVFVG